MKLDRFDVQLMTDGMHRPSIAGALWLQTVCLSDATCSYQMKQSPANIDTSCVGKVVDIAAATGDAFAAALGVGFVGCRRPHRRHIKNTLRVLSFRRVRILLGEN